MFVLRRRGLALFVFLICVAAVAGATWFFLRPHRRPNVLLITMDTTRWDRVSCYGKASNLTPAVDKLAAEGVRYEYALSPSSWTLPAHASIFTGTLPSTHRADFANTEGEVWAGPLQINKLRSDLPTLAEELKKAGYRTSAVVSGPLLHSRFGVDRGFDYYSDYDPKTFRVKPFNRPADQTTTSALQWLETYYFAPADTPFFLFVNYYDAHSPYHAPPPFGSQTADEERYDVRSGYYEDIYRGTRELSKADREFLTKEYEGEIRFVDSQIGRLFQGMKELGLYEETLIVVTADHGESFGEHNLLEHGRALYEELVRVPLIIKFPSWDHRHGLIKGMVSTISIMPTILHYLDCPIPDTVQYGTLEEKKSLLAAEISRDASWINMYGSRYDVDRQAVYDGDYKLIWNSNGVMELYNIRNDPAEDVNLYGKMPEVEQILQAKLQRLEKFAAPTAVAESPVLDEDLKKSLKALGYIR